MRISDIDVEGVREVDDKLVILARQMRCPILTNDYNLNRIAELQGVTVLNINELANAVKSVLLPGEHAEHPRHPGRQGSQTRALAIWMTAPWWWLRMAANYIDQEIDRHRHQGAANRCRADDLRPPGDTNTWLNDTERASK